MYMHIILTLLTEKSNLLSRAFRASEDVDSFTLNYSLLILFNRNDFFDAASCPTRCLTRIKTLTPDFYALFFSTLCYFVMSYISLVIIYLSCPVFLCLSVSKKAMKLYIPYSKVFIRSVLRCDHHRYL